MKAHPAANLFPLLEGAALQSLADDIKANGLQYPIITLDDRVLDGRNRLTACGMAKVEPRFRNAPSNCDPVTYVISANLHRRHLSESQRAMVANEVARLEAHRPGISASKEAVTQPQAAKLLNVSRASVQRAREVAEKSPALAEKVRAGKMTLGAAMRETKRATATKRLKSYNPPTTKDGPFGVIVADPPWAYDARAQDGSHRAANPYPSMSLDEIRALTIPAADDAILWLWTTNAHIEHAFEICRAWGFEPKTILTWFKMKMGLGDWLRGATEHCLMAVRGKPTVTLTNQTTALMAKPSDHSSKPEEFYKLVSTLCPDPRRLELFARRTRKDWFCSGADV
jgi:N6-adenosine-specific RNA methylase IME4